ncbi:hypothetical protein IGI04_019141 [Brassica rapa subsp. trilocularis]|uniref:Uncharacterized protein n=1 Tax=Brassica rapa subsp. trilocularis TaxID=1813537 RepID=A0ABQ7MEZ5_BRACM|nr:hypothetical protein IGI04_019141 [Brassica rapa subsp. trilocularis]
MIQSPKPVKPVLHLPQLEANRFNQLQTRHWRPGDHFNQSGDILGVQEEFCKFIPCTSNHWIRRILIYSNLPYLEQTDINVQQLFSLQIRHEIRTYQAPRKVPRNLSYPLKPSRFKKNQVSHLEPKSHKRLQRLVSDFTSIVKSTLNHQVNRKFIQFYQSCTLYKISVFRIQREILCCLIDFVSLEKMEELAQSQALLASQKTLLAAMKGVQDQISQLEKRNKAQGQQPQQGERRFGDALDAGYVEPKLPDPSWITKHQTSYTHEYSNSSYHDYNSADDVNIYSFSGSRLSSEYLTWERTMDDWFTYYGVPKKERLAHAIKVDKTHGKSPEEVVTNWEDLKDVMIRKYVSSRPSPEVRERYPRRFSSHGYKEAKRRVPKECHRSLFHQDQIRPDKRSTVFYDQYQPYEVPMSMEKNHFSPDTLARHKAKSDKPILQGKAKRFSSPSICEYQTLEGDSSPRKERPEPKPIIGLKRNLSAFQKAHYQEKWPRNYEVMIQSPKPVKPVLHLPQLEANRFNQLQTRHWRPGDHFNQSGDILRVQEEFCKFIPCTSNHWIRRILIYSNLPYLEQTDINVQQLFSLQITHEIRTYKAPRKVPRKLSYPLNRPGSRRIKFLIWSQNPIKGSNG